MSTIPIAQPAFPTLVPLLLEALPCGFPSPADDYLDKGLDLHAYLVKNPAATFLFRAAGDSMQGAGIFDCDVLVVDRSVEARPGLVVVAVLDGEHTVKRIGQTATGGLALLPANPAFPPIPLNPERDVDIWGVVTFVLHRP